MSTILAKLVFGGFLPLFCRVRREDFRFWTGTLPENVSILCSFDAMLQVPQLIMLHFWADRRFFFMAMQQRVEKRPAPSRGLLAFGIMQIYQISS